MNFFNLNPKSVRRLYLHLMVVVVVCVWGDREGHTYLFTHRNMRHIRPRLLCCCYCIVFILGHTIEMGPRASQPAWNQYRDNRLRGPSFRVELSSAASSCGEEVVYSAWWPWIAAFFCYVLLLQMMDAVLGVFWGIIERIYIWFSLTAVPPSACNHRLTESATLCLIIGLCCFVWNAFFLSVKSCWAKSQS